MIETTSCPLCGAPAEVLERHVMDSTDGPVEHAAVVCLLRHRFLLPVTGLQLGDAPDPADARPASPQDR